MRGTYVAKLNEPRWRRKLRLALFPWSKSERFRTFTRLGYFEFFMLFIYCCNIVVLGLSDGTSIRRYNQKAVTLKSLEMLFTWIYLAEIGLTTVAFGWSNMLNPLRLLDTTLVLCNLIILILYYSGFDRVQSGFTLLSIRCCLRMLRPILMTTSFPAIRVFVAAITRSMFELGDVLLLLLLFILWFGVAGTYQLGGKLRMGCVNQFAEAGVAAVNNHGFEVKAKSSWEAGVFEDERVAWYAATGGVNTTGDIRDLSALPLSRAFFDYGPDLMWRSTLRIVCSGNAHTKENAGLPITENYPLPDGVRSRVIRLSREALCIWENEESSRQPTTTTALPTTTSFGPTNSSGITATTATMTAMPTTLTPTPTPTSAPLPRTNLTLGDISSAVTSFAANFMTQHGLDRGSFICESDYVSSGLFLQDLKSALLLTDSNEEDTNENATTQPGTTLTPAPSNGGRKCGGAAYGNATHNVSITLTRSICFNESTDGDEETVAPQPPSKRPKIPILWYPQTITGKELFTIITSSFSVEGVDKHCAADQPCSDDPTLVLRGYCCPYGYMCQPTFNPYFGFIGFDNIAQTLLTILICLTFDIWHTVMFMARDGADVIAEFYFVILIVVGAFMVMNLTQVVLTVEYERAKEEEDRKIAKLLQNSDSSLGGGAFLSPNGGAPNKADFISIAKAAHAQHKQNKKEGADSIVGNDNVDDNDNSDVDDDAVTKGATAREFMRTIRSAIALRRSDRMLEAKEARKIKKKLKTVFLARKLTAKKERLRQERDQAKLEARQALERKLGKMGSSGSSPTPSLAPFSPLSIAGGSTSGFSNNQSFASRPNVGVGVGGAMQRRDGITAVGGLGANANAMAFNTFSEEEMRGMKELRGGVAGGVGQGMGGEAGKNTKKLNTKHKKEGSSSSSDLDDSTSSSSSQTAARLGGGGGGRTGSSPTERVEGGGSDVYGLRRRGPSPSFSFGAGANVSFSTRRGYDPISVGDDLWEDIETMTMHQFEYRIALLEFKQELAMAHNERDFGAARILKLRFYTNWLVVKARWFQTLMYLAALANIICLCTIHYDMPDYQVAALEAMNIIFVAVFTAEIAVDALSKPFLEFFQSMKHVYMMLVATLSWADVFVFWATGASNPWLASCRSLRMIRLLYLFPDVYAWMRYILVAIKASPILLFFLAQLLFIFSAFGTQAFGGIFCGLDDNQLTSLPNVLEFTYENVSVIYEPIYNTSNISSSNRGIIGYTPVVHREEATFYRDYASGFCDGLPMANFDTFGNSLITGFQILTGDDWSNMLFYAMERLNIGTAFAFIIYFYIGNYALLSLLVAILLAAGYHNEEEKSLELMMAEEKKRLAAKKRADLEEEMRARGEDPAAVSSSGVFDDDGKPLLPDGKKTDKEEEEEDDSEGSDFESVASSDRADREMEITRKASSKFVVLKSGKIRRKTTSGRLVDSFFLYFDISKKWARAIVEHLFTQGFMICVIFTGTFAFAAISPSDAPDTRVARTADIIDILVMVISVIEVILQIHAYGFVRRHTAYLRRDWFNILDFVLVGISVAGVVTSLTGLTSEYRALSVLRVFSSIRPIRMVKRSPGMRIVISAIFRAIPAIKAVVLCTLYIFVVWGIAGVLFYGGALQQCMMPDTSIYPQLSKSECAMVGGTWGNPGPHFDNIGAALMALYQITTLEGWGTFMYTTMNIRDPGEGMRRDANRTGAAFYFIPMAAFAGFFLTNVFSATLIEAYNDQKRKAAFQQSVFITREQTAWLTTNKRIARYLPLHSRQGGVRQAGGPGGSNQKGALTASSTPSSPLSSTGGGPDASLLAVPLLTSSVSPTRDNGNRRGNRNGFSSSPSPEGYTSDNSRDDDSGRGSSSDSSGSDSNSNDPMGHSSVFVSQFHSTSGFIRNKVRRIIRSNLFENLVTLSVFLNFASMAAEHYPQNESFTQVLTILNTVFVVLNCVEALVKIAGESHRVYFSAVWNRLDFFVAVVGLLFLCLDSLVDQKAIALVRGFRVFRLIVLTRGTVNVDKLLGKLGLAAAQLVYVFAIIILVFFVFALMGMRLFSTIKWNLFTTSDGIDSRSNFGNLHSSMMMMFRMMTGANWNELMYSCGVQEPLCDQQLGNCGNMALSYAYYFIYVTLAFFVLRSLVVAVLLDSFATSAINRCIRKVDAEKFYQTWRKYDPTETLKISPYDIIFLIRSMNPQSVLSVYDPNAKKRIAMELSFLTSLQLRNVRKPVHMAKIVDSLCARAFPVPPPQGFSFVNELHNDLLTGSVKGIFQITSQFKELGQKMQQRAKSVGGAAVKGIMQTVVGGGIGEGGSRARGRSMIQNGAVRNGSMISRSGGVSNTSFSIYNNNRRDGEGLGGPTSPLLSNSNTLPNEEATAIDIEETETYTGSDFVDERARQCAALIIINAVFSKRRDKLRSVVLEARIERQVKARIEAQLGVSLDQLAAVMSAARGGLAGGGGGGGLTPPTSSLSASASALTTTAASFFNQLSTPTKKRISFEDGGKTKGLKDVDKEMSNTNNNNAYNGGGAAGGRNVNNTIIGTSPDNLASLSSGTATMAAHGSLPLALLAISSLAGGGGGGRANRGGTPFNAAIQRQQHQQRALLLKQQNDIRYELMSTDQRIEDLLKPPRVSSFAAAAPVVARAALKDTFVSVRSTLFAAVLSPNALQKFILSILDGGRMRGGAVGGSMIGSEGSSGPTPAPSLSALFAVEVPIPLDGATSAVLSAVMSLTASAFAEQDSYNNQKAIQRGGPVDDSSATRRSRGHSDKKGRGDRARGGYSRGGLLGDEERSVNRLICIIRQSAEEHVVNAMLSPLLEGVVPSTTAAASTSLVRSTTTTHHNTDTCINAASTFFSELPLLFDDLHPPRPPRSLMKALESAIRHEETKSTAPFSTDVARPSTRTDKKEKGVANININNTTNSTNTSNKNKKLSLWDGSGLGNKNTSSEYLPPVLIEGSINFHEDGDEEDDGSEMNPMSILNISTAPANTSVATHAKSSNTAVVLAQTKANALRALQKSIIKTFKKRQKMADYLRFGSKPTDNEGDDSRRRNFPALSSSTSHFISSVHIPRDSEVYEAFEHFATALKHLKKNNHINTSSSSNNTRSSNKNKVVFPSSSPPSSAIDRLLQSSSGDDGDLNLLLEDNDNNDDVDVEDYDTSAGRDEDEDSRDEEGSSSTYASSSLFIHQWALKLRFLRDLIVGTRHLLLANAAAVRKAQEVVRERNKALRSGYEAACEEYLEDLHVYELRIKEKEQRERERQHQRKDKEVAYQQQQQQRHYSTIIQNNNPSSPPLISSRPSLLQFQSLSDGGRKDRRRTERERRGESSSPLHSITTSFNVNRNNANDSLFGSTADTSNKIVSFEEEDSKITLVAAVPPIPPTAPKYLTLSDIFPCPALFNSTNEPSPNLGAAAAAASCSGPCCFADLQILAALCQFLVLKVMTVVPEEDILSVLGPLLHHDNDIDNDKANTAPLSSTAGNATRRRGQGVGGSDAFFRGKERDAEQRLLSTSLLDAAASPTVVANSMSKQGTIYFPRQQGQGVHRQQQQSSAMMPPTIAAPKIATLTAFDPLQAAINAHNKRVERALFLREHVAVTAADVTSKLKDNAKMAVVPMRKAVDSLFDQLKASFDVSAEKVIRWSCSPYRLTSLSLRMADLSLRISKLKRKGDRTAAVKELQLKLEDLRKTRKLRKMGEKRTEKDGTRDYDEGEGDGEERDERPLTLQRMVSDVADSIQRTTLLDKKLAALISNKNKLRQDKEEKRRELLKQQQHQQQRQQLEQQAAGSRRRFKSTPPTLQAPISTLTLSQANTKVDADQEEQEQQEEEDVEEGDVGTSTSRQLHLLPPLEHALYEEDSEVVTNLRIVDWFRARVVRSMCDAMAEVYRETRSGGGGGAGGGQWSPTATTTTLNFSANYGPSSVVTITTGGKEGGKGQRSTVQDTVTVIETTVPFLFIPPEEVPRFVANNYADKAEGGGGRGGEGEERRKNPRSRRRREDDEERERTSAMYLENMDRIVEEHCVHVAAGEKGADEDEDRLKKEEEAMVPIHVALQQVISRVSNPPLSYLKLQQSSAVRNRLKKERSATDRDASAILSDVSLNTNNSGTPRLDPDTAKTLEERFLALVHDRIKATFSIASARTSSTSALAASKNHRASEDHIYITESSRWGSGHHINDKGQCRKALEKLLEGTFEGLLAFYNPLVAEEKNTIFSDEGEESAKRKNEGEAKTKKSKRRDKDRDEKERGGDHLAASSSPRRNRLRSLVFSEHQSTWLRDYFSLLQTAGEAGRGFTDYVTGKDGEEEEVAGGTGGGGVAVSEKRPIFTKRRDAERDNTTTEETAEELKEVRRRARKDSRARKELLSQFTKQHKRLAAAVVAAASGSPINENLSTPPASSSQVTLLQPSMVPTPPTAITRGAAGYKVEVTTTAAVGLSTVKNLVSAKEAFKAYFLSNPLGVAIINSLSSRTTDATRGVGATSAAKAGSGGDGNTNTNNNSVSSSHLKSGKRNRSLSSIARSRRLEIKSIGGGGAVSSIELAQSVTFDEIEALCFDVSNPNPTSSSYTNNRPQERGGRGGEATPFLSPKVADKIISVSSSSGSGWWFTDHTNGDGNAGSLLHVEAALVSDAALRFGYLHSIESLRNVSTTITDKIVSNLGAALNTELIAPTKILAHHRLLRDKQLAAIETVAGFYLTLNWNTRRAAAVEALADERRSLALSHEYLTRQAVGDLSVSAPLLPNNGNSSGQISVNSTTAAHQGRRLSQVDTKKLQNDEQIGAPLLFRKLSPEEEEEEEEADDGAFDRYASPFSSFPHHDSGSKEISVHSPPPPPTTTIESCVGLASVVGSLLHDAIVLEDEERSRRRQKGRGERERDMGNEKGRAKQPFDNLHIVVDDLDLDISGEGSDGGEMRSSRRLRPPNNTAARDYDANNELSSDSSEISSTLLSYSEGEEDSEDEDVELTNFLSSTLEDAEKSRHEGLLGSDAHRVGDWLFGDTAPNSEVNDSLRLKDLVLQRMIAKKNSYANNKKEAVPIRRNPRQSESESAGTALVGWSCESSHAHSHSSADLMRRTLFHDRYGYWLLCAATNIARALASSSSSFALGEQQTEGQEERRHKREGLLADDDDLLLRALAGRHAVRMPARGAAHISKPSDFFAMSIREKDGGEGADRHDDQQSKYSHHSPVMMCSSGTRHIPPTSAREVMATATMGGQMSRTREMQQQENAATIATMNSRNGLRRIRRILARLISGANEATPSARGETYARGGGGRRDAPVLQFTAESPVISTLRWAIDTPFCEVPPAPPTSSTTTSTASGNAASPMSNVTVAAAAMLWKKRALGGTAKDGARARSLGDGESSPSASFSAVDPFKIACGPEYMRVLASCRSRALGRDTASPTRRGGGGGGGGDGDGHANTHSSTRSISIGQDTKKQTYDNKDNDTMRLVRLDSTSVLQRKERSPVSISKIIEDLDRALMVGEEVEIKKERVRGEERVVDTQEHDDTLRGEIARDTYDSSYPSPSPTRPPSSPLPPTHTQPQPTNSLSPALSLPSPIRGVVIEGTNKSSRIDNTYTTYTTTTAPIHYSPTTRLAAGANAKASPSPQQEQRTVMDLDSGGRGRMIPTMGRRHEFDTFAWDKEEAAPSPSEVPFVPDFLRHLAPNRILNVPSAASSTTMATANTTAGAMRSSEHERKRRGVTRLEAMNGSDVRGDTQRASKHNTTIAPVEEELPSLATRKPPRRRLARQFEDEDEEEGGALRTPHIYNNAADKKTTDSQSREHKDGATNRPTDTDYDNTTSKMLLSSHGQNASTQAHTFNGGSVVSGSGVGTAGRTTVMGGGIPTAMNNNSTNNKEVLKLTAASIASECVRWTIENATSNPSLQDSFVSSLASSLASFSGFLMRLMGVSAANANATSLVSDSSAWVGCKHLPINSSSSYSSTASPPATSLGLSTSVSSSSSLATGVGVGSVVDGVLKTPHPPRAEALMYPASLLLIISMGDKATRPGESGSTDSKGATTGGNGDGNNRTLFEGIGREGGIGVATLFILKRSASSLPMPMKQSLVAALSERVARPQQHHQGHQKGGGSGSLSPFIGSEFVVGSFDFPFPPLSAAAAATERSSPLRASHFPGANTMNTNSTNRAACTNVIVVSRVDGPASAPLLHVRGPARDGTSSVSTSLSPSLSVARANAPSNINNANSNSNSGNSIVTNALRHPFTERCLRLLIITTKPATTTTTTTTTTTAVVRGAANSGSVSSSSSSLCLGHFVCVPSREECDYLHALLCWLASDPSGGRK